jgi:DNA polymerase-3 subunit alpha
MESIAICDDGNLFGSLEFANECVKYGIKPIIGVTMKLHKLNREIGEISIYAKNAEGYANILQITNSEFAINGSGTIPIEVFEKFCGDIIAISPSIEVLKLINPFFTKGEIFAEFSRFTNEQDEIKKEADLVKFACENSLPLVATNASYFESEELFPSQDALLCVKTGRFTVEEDRQMFTPNHNFKTEKKFEKLFKDIPHAVLHTNFIAEKCNYYPKPQNPIMPKFAENEAFELQTQARAGLEKRLLDIGMTKGFAKEDYTKRLEYEIGIISKMGFDGYFLIVSDFIKWSKENGIAVGPGRGSGVGSLVAYSLYITDLDPLRYGLFFERFLDPERVSMPDFDVDFCQEERHKVIEYVQQKYGREKVAAIVTFGRLQARAVLKDVGRVLQIPYTVVDRICKMVPFNPTAPVTLEQAIAMDKDLQEQKSSDDMIANLLEIGMTLEGLVRHTSTHAAGIIISNDDLCKSVPLVKSEDQDLPAVGYSMKMAEMAGLVKFDFLGLKTLTVIKKACILVKKNTGIEITLAKIPLDDPKTFELLQNGLTKGVFQLDAAIPRDAMKQMKIDTIDDIIALTSLNRPGPMENLPSFILRKIGKEKIVYPHPLFEDTLKGTYGIIIYQEQVIKIAQVFAGYSFSEADMLRRAMGKKDKDEMERQKTKFIDGAKKNSVETKKAEEIFALVEKFAGYGFNKAHAAAYSVISFHTAYLKAHYPLEFYTSLLNLDIGNTDNLNIFIAEAKHCGIEFITPNVNTSSTFFKIVDGKIEYALSAIKGVGEMATVQIEQERKNGNFTDVFDFAERLGTKFSNKKVVEGLAKAGGFLKLHQNTNEILQNIQSILSYAEKEKSDDSQFSLFGDAEVKTRPIMKQASKMTANEALLSEFEAFGFYLSSHPLMNFSERIERYEIKSFTQVNEMLPEDSSEFTVKMAGVISILKQRSGSRGRFAFLHISDLTGLFEVAIFKDDIIEKNRDILEIGKVIIMNVSASRHESGNARLIVNDLTSIENDYKIQEFRGSSPKKFWQKKDDKKDEKPRELSNAKFETQNNNQMPETSVDTSFLHSKKMAIDAENISNLNEVLSEIRNFKSGETQVLITTKGFKIAIGFYTIPMDFIRKMGQAVKL